MKASLIPRGADARREAAEDYALRKVPAHWKRPAFSFAMSLSGLTSSVFFLALGGRLTQSFGFPSAMTAFAIGAIVGRPGSAVIARVTTMTGLDLDLITRGSGFLGSAVTSLIHTDLEVVTPTLCPHGDMPNVLDVAHRVRRRLAEEDIEIVPLAPRRPRPADERRRAASGGQDAPADGDAAGGGQAK